MPLALTRPALLAAIAQDPLLTALLARLRREADEDPAHDVEHLLRVAQSTLALIEDASTLRDCVGAALLHDLVNLPKNSPERARASQLSAARARELLHELPPESVQRIAEAIEDHSYSAGRKPRSALGRALQDADRLEALGALGIARTFSTGARMGARYFDPNDPWAEARPLDDARLSVDHFFKKLLGLAESFCTQAGRREAERRTEVLRHFLRALAHEIGVPLAPSRLGEDRSSAQPSPEGCAR